MHSASAFAFDLLVFGNIQMRHALIKLLSAVLTKEAVLSSPAERKATQQRIPPVPLASARTTKGQAALRRLQNFHHFWLIAPPVDHVFEYCFFMTLASLYFQLNQVVCATGCR